MSVSAAEGDDIGAGSLWDGTFNVHFPNAAMYLEHAYDFYYNLTETTAKPKNTALYYESSDNAIITINSYTTDVYLNGSFRIRVTTDPEDAINDNLNYLNVSCTPIVLPGVYVTTDVIERVKGGATTFDIVCQFQNYYVTNSQIVLPLHIQVSASAVYSTPTVNADSVISVGMNIVSDYNGDIMQYDRLEDVPSMDGYIADQNQQIINNSQTQITVTQQQMEQQHADSQAQIDATNNQTNTLVNGYDSSAGSDVKSQFDSIASDLDGAEASLFDAFAYDGVNYDPFSDYLNSQAVKDVFSFVSSLMSSIWNALGDFSIPIYLGLLIVVVTRFLGYQQMSSGGGD